MFCPKCGKKLPDNAVFCGGCGNRLKSAPTKEGAKQAPLSTGSGANASAVASGQAPAPKAMPASVASPSPAPQQVTQFPQSTDDRFATAVVPSQSSTQAPVQASSSALTPVGIIGRVAAVATLVCMFLPWIGMPALRTLGNYGAALGLNTAGDYAYSMFDLGELVDMVNSIFSSNSLASQYMLFFVAWVIAVILLVAGLVVSLIGKKNSLFLIPGGALAALVAVVWFVVISNANADLAGQISSLIKVNTVVFELPPAVFLTILFGAVTVALGIVAKPRA